MKPHIRSILYTPVILLADNNEVAEYQAPTAATKADSVKSFTRANQESHQGAWDGKFYTVPHSSLLLVNVQVSGLASDNGEDKPIDLFVTRERAGVQVHFGYARQTINQPLATIVPVEKGDKVWVHWAVTEAVTATGAPLYTHLSIVEI